jgi:hypothetical protein
MCKNCSWRDFVSSILTSGISTLCLYDVIQLYTKHMAGFLASLELSPSLEQIEFCRNFLSKWNFLGILFGGLLARIAEYLLNGSPREVKFQTVTTTKLPLPLSCHHRRQAAAFAAIAATALPPSCCHCCRQAATKLPPLPPLLPPQPHSCQAATAAAAATAMLAPRFLPHCCHR